MYSILSTMILTVPRTYTNIAYLKLFFSTIRQWEILRMFFPPGFFAFGGSAGGSASVDTSEPIFWGY